MTRKRLYTEITLRYIFRYEMQDLVELFGNFDGSPFRHGGEQIWVLENAE